MEMNETLHVSLMQTKITLDDHDDHDDHDDREESDLYYRFHQIEPSYILGVLIVHSKDRIS